MRCQPHFTVAVDDAAVCLNVATRADVVCVVTPNSFNTKQDFDAAHSLASHLGDADTPAIQLAGRDIVRDGIVGLITLTELIQVESKV